MEKNENKSETTEKTNGFAVAGLVCSLCGLITCGFTSLIGLVLSIIGLSKSKNNNGNGKGLAIGGIISGVIILIINIIIITIFTLAMTGIVSDTTKTAKRIIEDSNERVSTYTFGKTLTFRNLKIKLGKDYQILTVDKTTSPYYGKQYIKMPIYIENIGKENNRLNMFYYTFSSENSDSLSSLGLLIDDSVEMAQQLKPGENYTKFFYILYDGTGEYTITFSFIDSMKYVKFNINN